MVDDDGHAELFGPRGSQSHYRAISRSNDEAPGTRQVAVNTPRRYGANEPISEIVFCQIK